MTIYFDATTYSGDTCLPWSKTISPQIKAMSGPKIVRNIMHFGVTGILRNMLYGHNHTEVGIW